MLMRMIIWYGKGRHQASNGRATPEFQPRLWFPILSCLGLPTGGGQVCPCQPLSLPHQDGRAVSTVIKVYGDAVMGSIMLIKGEVWNSLGIGRWQMAVNVQAHSPMAASHRSIEGLRLRVPETRPPMTTAGGTRYTRAMPSTVAAG